MPNSDSKTYIVNDQPTEKDALDFTPYVETLADIIQTGKTPLTIGVFGTWGSGKTSLMKMVKNQLPKDFTVAWFDAWKYDKEETLWRALLLSVLAQIKETAKNQKNFVNTIELLETKLYRDIDIEKVGGVKVDLLKLGGIFAKGTVQLGLSFIPGGAILGKFVDDLQKSGSKALTDDFTQAIQRERTKIHIEQVRFLEQFQDEFNTIVQQLIKPKRLVVFVDDLDRCLPDKAIQVLEAIKLFLDVENCVFVLGIDQDVITRGIEMKYKEFKDQKSVDGQPGFTIEGINYLEKIIQLPFQIPPIAPSGMEKFIRSLSTEWPNEECPKVFEVGLGDNPRQVKRTVNVFLMLWKLANRRKIQETIKPIRLAKVVAIQTVYPDLFNRLLKEEPRYLRALEEYYRNDANYKEEPNDQGGIKEKRPEPPHTLDPFLSQRGIAAVQRILMMEHEPKTQDAGFAGLSTDELNLYFTLTRSAEAPQATPPASEAARPVFEPQMVRIPAGKFLMGSTKEQAAQAIKYGLDKQYTEWEQPQHTVDLSEYFIGKYPITNREYQAFVREAKHKPPQGWDGDQFPPERGSHPVVNVSWDNANAYCKWLSEKSNKQYRLPTEAEWEKAARGEDGNVYAWGNDFNPTKANTSESNIGDTSDVGKYSPQGDSPYGCADMIGNVWEWCNDRFNKDEYKDRVGMNTKDPQGPQEGSYRVLRGGSFYSGRWNARCADRSGNGPDSTNSSRGFRVASSPAPTVTT